MVVCKGGRLAQACLCPRLAAVRVRTCSKYRAGGMRMGSQIGNNNEAAERGGRDTGAPGQCGRQSAASLGEDKSKADRKCAGGAARASPRSKTNEKTIKKINGKLGGGHLWLAAAPGGQVAKGVARRQDKGSRGCHGGRNGNHRKKRQNFAGLPMIKTPGDVSAAILRDLSNRCNAREPRHAPPSSCAIVAH